MRGFEKALADAEAGLRGALAGVDLRGRLVMLGVPFREIGEGLLGFRLLDREIAIDGESALLSLPGGGAPAPAERIIALRYLAAAVKARRTGELISFRDLPGGMFYYGPFTARAVAPLVRALGDDLALLRRGLAGLSWEPFDTADFGACIGVMGPVALYLLYWRGDDEFEARADYLLDASARRIFGAEEVAALASRVTEIIRGTLR